MEYYKNYNIEDIDGEIWKEIENFKDYYVSNFGRIKSHKRNRVMILKQKDIRGYKNIVLRNENTQKTFQIHRLVAIYFIPNPENKPTVNHKDLVKHNNFIDNLEWSTHQEQIIHSYLEGNRSQVGENNNATKLNNELVRQILIKGKFDSWSNMEKFWNISRGTLWNIIKRKVWKHIII